MARSLSVACRKMVARSGEPEQLATLRFLVPVLPHVIQHLFDALVVSIEDGGSVVGGVQPEFDHGSLLVRCRATLP